MFCEIKFYLIEKMDSFETHTWANFVVQTTFLGIPTGLMPIVQRVQRRRRRTPGL
jgi:hypothetical protein